MFSHKRITLLKNVAFVNDHAAFSSSRAELDAAVASLRANLPAWEARDALARADTLERCLVRMQTVTDAWVQASIQTKGYAPKSSAAAEEWAYVAVILRSLRLFKNALTDIATSGVPKLSDEPLVRPDLHTVLPVFPQSFAERMLFKGVTAEVWFNKGMTPEGLERRTVAPYAEQPPAVTLVLAASSIASGVIDDTLQKLFVENRVVLLKLSPIMAYLGPLLEQAFAPLFDLGVLRLAYGGRDEGAYLAQHPGIDEVHLSGSRATYGTLHTAVSAKPFSAQLGSVNPVIVVPGAWTEADIRYQAANLAAMTVSNVGANPFSSRVIVQHATWEGRQRLLKALRWCFRKIPTRRAYQTQARGQFERILAAHPDAERYGREDADKLPWTLIPGLHPDADSPCYLEEARCGVIAETIIPAATVEDYLEKAVAFANERLEGGLSVTLLVHPQMLADERLSLALERALESLRYGSVCVNTWGGFAYFIGLTPWGVYDAEASGFGFTHNPLMLQGVEKSVIRAPFRNIHTATLTGSGGNPYEITRWLAGFEARPSFGKLPGLILSLIGT